MICWRMVERRSSTRVLTVERTYPSGTRCATTRIVVLDLYFSGAITQYTLAPKRMRTIEKTMYHFLRRRMSR